MSESLGLGHPIPEGAQQQRDAIHIAVVPVRASVSMQPGTKVTLLETRDDGEHTVRPAMSEKPIGVIDPFLTEAVATGERCWLFLNPGSITSLRHDWTHDAFNDALTPAQEATVRQVTDKLFNSEHKKYLTEFAAGLGHTYESFMDEIADCLSSGDSFHTGDNQIDAPGHEFWTHYEAIAGKVPDQAKDDLYFSCSC
jgi:hypothetical protein